MANVTSLRIACNVDSAYEQNEMETPRVEIMIPEPTKLVCIGYTDSHSVNENSQEDLRIGYENGLVASSKMSQLKSTRVGDLVIVKDQTNHFVIGRIVGMLEEGSSLWLRSGGLRWDVARKVQWITEIRNVESFVDEWVRCCEELNIPNPKRIFNCRICGHGTAYVGALWNGLRNETFPSLRG